MEDIFENDRDAEKITPERSFRYPFYERHLWIVVAVVGVVALVFLPRIIGFVRDEKENALTILSVAGFFVLVILWISFRALTSKVVISPSSLKSKAFCQAYQRISWAHIQKVVYKWRPLGHKLVFVGSDGAKVPVRSAVNEYDLLLSYIRENCPDPVRDQLDDLFGDDEEGDHEELEDQQETEGPEEGGEGQGQGGQGEGGEESKRSVFGFLRRRRGEREETEAYDKEEADKGVGEEGNGGEQDPERRERPTDTQGRDHSS